MSVQNLSSICPDKLFEDSSISEIKTLQVKLKIEVERKREELRTMVGERYRDLIEAADTISVMKSNAEKIIKHIESMSSKCLELQEKHLLGFKLDSNACDTERYIARKPYIMLAVQVKLLMIIPEAIWSAMDEEGYLLAAQLFLLARHINTSLQFSSGEDFIDSSKVLTWFPVLTHQWNTIGLFRNSILNGCKGKLKLTDITIESASSCLATDLLLEGCSLEASENMFLNLRMESLKNILASDAETSIKEQICQSLKLLAQTLYFRHMCFIEEDSNEGKCSGNLVSRKLSEIVSSEAPKTFSILNITNEYFHKYLPLIIQEFRPSWSQEVVAKTNTDERLAQWLNSVKAFFQEKLVYLLELVTSIKGLYAIREGAWEVLSKNENQVIPSSLPVGIEKGGLWEMLIRPLMTNRVIQLISTALERALDDLKSDLQEAASNAGVSRSNSTCNSECNLDWYIWKEWPQDLFVAEVPLVESKDNHGRLHGWMLTSSRSQKTPSGLEMKAKGYSPMVQKLCQNFDSHFEALLEDFIWYVCDKDQSSSKVPKMQPFNKFIDRGELKQQLQTRTFECIKSLLSFVKEEMLKHCFDDQETDVNEAGAVMVGRFFMGLMELCPQLQKCMCPSNIGDTRVGSYGISSVRTGPETNCWAEACRLMGELSTEALRVWRKAAGRRMHLRVKRSLTIPPSSVDLLKLLPAWDQVTIEEGSEEGQSIKSTIRVPCHPSFALHNILFSSCQEINRLTPHTLPSKIHQELIEDLARSLLDNYEPISAVESIPQIQALQFFFDVEYIIHLFLSRDNKVSMEQARRICDKMKAFIDPFDYDVFYPHIMRNIKASVRKTQTLLGVALSQDKVVSLSRANSQGGKENLPPEPKDPSIMPLPMPAPPCFPLLPLSHAGGLQRQSPGRDRVGISLPPDKQGKKMGKPSQSSSSAQPTLPQKKGTSEQSSSSGLIARSGAFFGAMGSDWF